MSRGIGQTQKLILESLDSHGPLYLSALAGGDGMARYKSIYRAAMRLFEESKLEVFNAYTNPRVIIAPAGMKSLGPTCGEQARDVLKEIHRHSIIVMHSLGFELPLYRNWAGHWLNNEDVQELLKP